MIAAPSQIQRLLNTKDTKDTKAGQDYSWINCLTQRLNRFEDSISDLRLSVILCVLGVLCVEYTFE